MLVSLQLLAMWVLQAEVAVHDAPHTIRSAAGQLVAITHANVVAVPDGIAQQSVAVVHAAARLATTSAGTVGRAAGRGAVQGAQWVGNQAQSAWNGARRMTGW